MFFVSAGGSVICETMEDERWRMGKMVDLPHVTVCTEPLGQNVEALGEVMVGLNTISASEEIGDAVTIAMGMVAARRRVVRLRTWTRVVGKSLSIMMGELGED
jgi:hypothetical protein